MWTCSCSVWLPRWLPCFACMLPKLGTATDTCTLHAAAESQPRHLLRMVPWSACEVEHGLSEKLGMGTTSPGWCSEWQQICPESHDSKLGDEGCFER